MPDALNDSRDGEPRDHHEGRDLWPREFGKDTGLWTLPLAAEVCQAEGVTAGPVSGETVRATLARLGVKWQRAKRWIASPDPAYRRKKASATA